MARIELFTCDVCGAAVNETPSKGMHSYSQPHGWYSMNGRHICGLSCVALYAANPGTYPAQELKPDPFVEAFKTTFSGQAVSGEVKT